AETCSHAGMGTSFSVAQAIYQAINDSVDIINMSFGMYSNDPTISQAVADAYQQGIAMVASAGNDSTDSPAYPAALSEVLAVSAIDSAEYVAGFSNFGSHVDISGPGVDVYSALAGEYEWGTWSGTSFSAATASGISALSLDADTLLTVSGLYERLRQTARTDLTWGTVTPPDQYYGYGVVDAWAAVTYQGGGSASSAAVTVTDVTFIVAYLFNGGPAPYPLEAGNIDGIVGPGGPVDVADLAYLITYLFKSEATPVIE
ncbi:MAG: S8 family serine peptidase, partial [Candidatus Zixiibacteriota bacterium]